MKWLSRLRKRLISQQAPGRDKEEAIKEIQKEIAKLRDEYKKVELRPCRGDTDLHQRENELEDLKFKIYALQKERDTYVYTWAKET